VCVCNISINHNLSGGKVGQGYGKTCGFSTTGSVGISTLVDFGILWHTANYTNGIAGMHRYYYYRVSVVLKLVFCQVNLFFHTVMQLNMGRGHGSASHAYIPRLESSLLQYYTLC
jgi:hypothetical protein